MAGSARVTIGATPTLIVDTDGLGHSGALGRYVIRNRDAAKSVDLGNATVTAGAGYELGPLEAISYDQTGNTAAEDTLYGVVSSGTARVDVLVVDL